MNKKTAKDLILNARGQLIGRYGQAILVIIVVLFLNWLIASFADLAYNGTISSSIFRFIILLIINLLMGVLSFGEDRYFLNLVRGTQGLSPADLFYGVKNSTDKAICLKAVYTLASLISGIPLVYLSLFVVLTERQSVAAVLLISFFELIIIFVVKMFFGLCFYILSDKPELSFKEILAESNRLMKGNRFKFILLLLRTIPYMILGWLALVVGFLWPYAIYKTALANFYLDTIGEEPYNPLWQKEPEGTDTSQPLF
ncbi:Uncharacterized membrane protein [Lachnospiraceae bacterium YSD2013]|nr:Uncharacterized membrane protein [Lachnospiraceae bacterium YSD2013]